MFFFAKNARFWAKFGLKIRAKFLYLSAFLRIARSKNVQKRAVSSAEERKRAKKQLKIRSVDLMNFWTESISRKIRLSAEASYRHTNRRDSRKEKINARVGFNDCLGRFE